jgi:ethanolamine utilization protein EutM
MKALGMIEVYGYLAAVEALDSALKAANVTMVDVTLVQGGLVTVLITGDVGAVKAAMDASRTAAERVGRVISVHVIPRPSERIEKMLPARTANTLPSGESPETAEQQETAALSKENEPLSMSLDLDTGDSEVLNAPMSEPQEEPELQQELELQPEPELKQEQTPTSKVTKKQPAKAEAQASKENSGEASVIGIERKQVTPEQLKEMTVEHLRGLARELEITDMTRKQIRFATKHELIESISKFIEQER